MKINESTEHSEGCFSNSCDECDGVLLREDEERGCVASPCPIYLENRFTTSEERWLGYLGHRYPKMRALLDRETQLTIPLELEPDEERRAQAERALVNLNIALEKFIQTWMEPKPHRGVILIGPVGSGKTRAAIWLARKYVQITKTWVEVSVEREMLMAFTESFQHSGPDWRRERVWSCPALYLDDVGTKLNYTDAQLDEENNLLMHHDDKGHLLILTTNKYLVDEKDEYGNTIEKGLVGEGIIDDRLASRLMASCALFSTHGIPDWRMLSVGL